MRVHALVLGVAMASACARPKPPVITPHSIEVTSVSAQSIGMHVNLDVQNPNAFPLVVRSVAGHFYVNDTIDMGQTSVPSGISVAANATQAVSTDVSVPWMNIAALAPLALSGKPVPYRFDGTATIGGESLNIDVPFKIAGTLTSAQLLQAGLNSLPKLPGFP